MITPFVARPSRYPPFPLVYGVRQCDTPSHERTVCLFRLSLEIRHNPLFFNQFLARGGRHLNCHDCWGLFLYPIPKRFLCQERS